MERSYRFNASPQISLNMIIRQFHGWNASLVVYLFVLLRLVAFVKASQGDRLPEFRRCISVRLKDPSQSDDRDAQFDDRFAWRRTARMETLQSVRSPVQRRIYLNVVDDS